MLSSKARIQWIKWHAYISCFFLPLALLFTFTGVLYLLDVKGGASSYDEYIIQTEKHFPLKEIDAEVFALAFIKKIILK